METKKKGKEIGTLLGVGTAFIPVHTFNKEEYVALFAFKETVKGLEKDLIELEEENKKLKEERDFFFQQADRFRNETKKLREQIDLLKKQQ